MIVQANGIDLCAETFGDRAGPAIVLIHGAGNSMLSWEEDFCERLAAGPRFVIRYDMRDAGRSVTYEPGEPPYTLGDLAGDVVGLLDSYGLAKAHLVGMSMGAAIAQLVALAHPERVASLTLASFTPGDPSDEQPDLPGVTDELKAAFADPPPAPDWSDRPAVIEYLVEAHRPFAARSRPFDEAAMREQSARVYDRSANIEANLTNHYLVKGADPRGRERLAQIAAPALVIHGTEDPMFPLEHGRALASEIPGAELLALERTGHEYFPRESWDTVVPALLAHTATASA